MARATRERDERRKAADDEAETLRRRALSPAARRAEDEKIGKGKKPEKAKWKFLQKYHHKGAFFMDDDTLAKAGEGDVRNRATDGAVLEDKFDRAALPKVMQVKDFGFKGRTKYTHLSDQDTTFVDRDNPMNVRLQRRHKADDRYGRGYDRRRGGTRLFNGTSTRQRQIAGSWSPYGVEPRRGRERPAQVALGLQRGRRGGGVGGAGPRFVVVSGTSAG